MKIATNLKQFETSSNHPASPTKANLPVPWPRLEPQVAQSTRLRSGRYRKEMPTSAGSRLDPGMVSSQTGRCVGPQPQCHKLQKKRFETSKTNID
jgi:hypothetical protein